MFANYPFSQRSNVGFLLLEYFATPIEIWTQLRSKKVSKKCNFPVINKYSFLNRQKFDGEKNYQYKNNTYQNNTTVVVECRLETQRSIKMFSQLHKYVVPAIWMLWLICKNHLNKINFIKTDFHTHFSILIP